MYRSNLWSMSSKTTWLLAPHQWCSDSSIIFPAQLSSCANQARRRCLANSGWDLGTEPNKANPQSRAGCEVIHLTASFLVPSKSMALLRLNYLTGSDWSCLQAYVSVQQMPVCTGREKTIVCVSEHKSPHSLPHSSSQAKNVNQWRRPDWRLT